MRQSRGRGSKVETEARPREAKARPIQLKKTASRPPRAEADASRTPSLPPKLTTCLHCRRCCVLLQWDAFSLPELEAFLRILNREEESYCYQIRLKYGAKKKASEMRLRQLADDAASQRGTVTTAGHA